MRNCDRRTGEACHRRRVNPAKRTIFMLRHGTEGFVMRPFTSVLVVIMLAVAPVTAASAQVSNSSQGSPLPGQTGGTQQQLQSIPLVIPPSLPDTSALDGRIPAPLQAPPQPPTINGPVALTPLPAQPPALAPPLTQGAAPSVFQSQGGPSVLQSQTSPSVFQSQTGL